MLSSRVSCRISSAPGCGPQPRWRPAFRAPRDNARRQILHPAPADQHNRVLLQVMANARNIRRHFDAIGQADARHFAERRVRLFRSLGIHTRAHAALLRTRLQSRTRRLIPGPLAAKFHQLIKRRHSRHSQTRPAASLPCVPPASRRPTRFPVGTELAPSPVLAQAVAPGHALPRSITNAGENSSVSRSD